MRNFLFIFILLFISCDDAVLPKPKAYLSLDYPAHKYQEFPLERPYIFEISNQANAENLPNNWVNINYPKFKASIDITYRNVDNNLQELLIEAEKLVYKHTQKADQISAKNFINADEKVFGTMHEITGNAASQLQFHLTDSTSHFLKGSLYFYAKPNYDSILPAVDYIKQDLLKLMETTKWKND